MIFINRANLLHQYYNYNKTNKITRLVTNLTYVAIVFGQSPPIHYVK